MLMPTTTTDPPDKTEQQNVEPIKLSTTSPQPFDSFPTFRKTTTTFRAHRRQIKLGPYLLLRTLGEGEFGKVKLAVHTQTGQEFAIKLIRKETVGCSASRLNKVEREIHALKTLKHPYIVKLFNVVETEKYIGIILEYASGGELFEYILAHRSLKEKDARRLFAQLISSVHYMHRKKIVHRDLKLENLLLDRHRNIIVTDFGFANQFSSKEDDLMATSCGSPCYAAPELVVNDGLYAGSSVDIWSCGVILYAMLCGYLPFDDDPCNPDGNNISLLYRYILTNPPAFPKHISAEAQDLLSQMLVPDPSKRCTLETIEQHPWLKQYRSLFEKTDDELEKEAAVAAEQSFIPSYRRMVWSNSQATNTCNEGGGGGDHDENGDDDQKAVDTENVSIIAPLKEMKADTAAGEKKNKGGGVTEDYRSRPATVHAATLRRLTVGRPAADKVGIPTYRNRKARTAIVVDNNSNSIHDHSSPRRRPPCPFPTELSPVTPKPTKAQLPRRERLLSFFTGTKYQPSHVRKRCASMAPPPTTLSSPTTPTKTDKEGPKQNDSTAMELSSAAAAAAATATQQPHHQFETLMPSKLRSKFMASLRMRRKDPAKPVLASEIQDSIQAHRQESLKALTRGMNEKSMTLGIHSGRMAAEAVMSKNNKKEAVTHGSGRTDRARNTNNRHSLDPATLVGMVASIDTPSSPPPPPPTPSQHHQQIKSKTGKVMAWIKRRSQGKDRRQSAETTVTTQSFSSNSNNPAVSSNLPPPPSVSPPSPPVLDDNEVIKPGSHTMVGLSEMIDNNVQQAESKLRVHHGALDKTALTSKSPDQLMIQVSHTLCALGIVIKNDGDYTLKCVRPKAKVHQAPRLPPSAPNMLTATMTTTTTTNNGTSCSDDDEDDESIEDDDEDAQTAPSVQSLFPDPGHLSAASSIVQEDEEEKGEEAEEEAGERIPKPSSHSLLSISSNTSQQQHQQSGGAYDNMPRSFTEPIYGNPTIDSGEEIRFIVEICRFRNLPGLYILDIRRIRGNVWAYKFVYHKLLDLLNLGEGGGYLQHQQRPGAGIVDTAATSAAENKYGVLRSSPFLVKPLPPPLLKDSAVYGIASEKQQQQQAPQMVSP